MQIIEYLWKKLELMVNFLTELFSKLVNKAVILFQDDSQIAIGCYWKDCYEVISRCNVLIANIDRVDNEEKLC